MATTVNYKPARESWLIIVAILAAVALLLSLFGSCNSGDTGSNEALTNAAGQVEALADETLAFTVDINETVSVNTDIMINQEVPVTIDTTVDVTVPLASLMAAENLGVAIETSIPFQQDLMVPVTLSLDQLLPAGVMDIPAQEVAIPLDITSNQVLPATTDVPDQEVDIPLDLTVNQDYIVDTEFLGQPITVPLNISLDDSVFARAMVPVGQILDVPLGNAMGINDDLDDLEMVIPIPTAQELMSLIPPGQTAFVVELPVSINTDIPVSIEAPVSMTGDSDQEITITVPINTEVMVPLNQTVPVSFEVPIQTAVDVEVPLSETSLGPKLDALAGTLKNTSN